jgi:photosystem II stability/assembly factor-like uncharacterized protein
VPVPTTYIDCWYDEERHKLYIAASIDELDEEEETFISAIVACYPNGNFGARTLNGIRARSIASNARFIWVIGTLGEVWTYRGDEKVATEEVLPDSGVRSKRHLGRPERIRLIDDVPYVCGYAGQIYTLADGRWVHMDDGIVEPEGKVDSIMLEGIHGTSAKNIVVVGSGGILAHWDGRAWTKIPLLTTANLAGVRALSKSQVVAVGDDGVFIEWDGARRSG